MVICELEASFNQKTVKLLRHLNVSYFPEARCYLRTETKEIDITFPEKYFLPRIKILKSYIIQ